MLLTEHLKMQWGNTYLPTYTAITYFLLISDVVLFDLDVNFNLQIIDSCLTQVMASYHISSSLTTAKIILTVDFLIQRYNLHNSQKWNHNLS